MTSKFPATIAFLGSLLAAGSATADDTQARQDARDKQRLVSSLWVFASLNYLYCDVIGLMDSNLLRQYESGKVNGFVIDENFLLGGAILMQVPLSMIFLSTVLSPRASRIANIAAGATMTAVQTASLFVAKPTKYYAFSSGIEIATTSFITIYALLYMKPPKLTPIVEATPGGVTLKAGFTF